MIVKQTFSEKDAFKTLQNQKNNEMKNITAYSILLLLLISCFSCVKEKDLIIEGEPEVITQNGETRLLTGIVRDTSGIILSEAHVKVILEDLELETEADENGEWSLTVPKSLTEGFIVANKVEYSKSIQRFNETADNRVEDIYLAREQSNTELDISLSVSNLVTVRGRIIDSNSNPIFDVRLYIFSLLDSTQNEYVFSGFVTTSQDGTFEIIYEDNGYSSSTLVSTFSRGCSDRLIVTWENQNPDQDLGDLELSYESFSVFQTRLESDGSSCYETVSTLAYHFDSGTGSSPVSYDQPLGDISLEYCPGGNGAFYIGVESEDNTHFNGLFFTDAEVEESYMLDICTPNPGNFLELNIDGNVTVYHDDLLYLDPGAFVLQDPDTSVFFWADGWSTFTPLGSDDPAYQIGKVWVLSIGGANGAEFYKLDEDSRVKYVNIVQDDDVFFAGVAKAKLIANDGSEADLTIRFRVSK